MDRVSHTFMGKLMEQMVDLAETTMMSPPEGEFKLGQASGRYQGMRHALNLMEDILRDNFDKERDS